MAKQLVHCESKPVELVASITALMAPSKIPCRDVMFSEPTSLSGRLIAGDPIPGIFACK